MKSTSDERYQQLSENRKCTTTCYWISRAERGNCNNAKQTGHPRSKKSGTGSTGFSMQRQLLTQPLTCSPFSPPRRTRSPLRVTVLTCDSEEDAGLESGKIGVHTGRQRMGFREQPAQRGVQGQGRL